MSNLKDLLADLTSGDEDRAEAAVPEILSLGEKAFPALQELLDSEDVDHRWWAIRVLAQSPHPQTRSLLPFLNDPASEVRQAAALGLANHPSELAVQPLIQALSDSDPLVSNLACNALVKIGHAAVPYLMEVFEHLSPPARINAMRALAEIADYRAVPTLMAALEEDSAMLQHWAEEGLERLGLNMIYIKPD